MESKLSKEQVLEKLDKFWGFQVMDVRGDFAVADSLCGCYHIWNLANDECLATKPYINQAVEHAKFLHTSNHS